MAPAPALAQSAPIPEDARGEPPSPEPLTLDAALERATATSEQVAIARAGVERAAGTEQHVQSERLPQLDAGMSYTRILRSEFRGVFDDPGFIDPGVEIPFGQDHLWNVNLSFRQALYTGGRITAQAEAAGASRRAASLGVNTTRAEVELDVTTAYYDAALSDRLLFIAEAALEQAEATLRQVELEHRTGAQSEFAVLRARVSRDGQRPVVIRQRSERELAYLRLRQLLDLPLDQPLELAVDLEAVSDPPARRFAEALAEREPALVDIDRTVVQQVVAQVAASDASVRAARAERMPSLSFTSRYSPVAYRGAPDFGDFRTNWDVGVAVSVPLLTGGRLRAAETSARADLAENEARLHQARELAMLDTRRAYEDYRAARAAWEASAGTVEQAQRAHEIAELRFREGLSTQLELSDARLQLEQARANRAQAARDLQIARARLALLADLPVDGVAASPARVQPAPRSVDRQPAALPTGTIR